MKTTKKTSSRTAQQQVQPLTWLGRPWRNRAWLHPLFGSGAVYAAGQLLHATEALDSQHWLLRGAAAVALPAIGGMAGLVSAAGDRFSEAARGFLISAGAGAGVWLSAAMLTSPYSQMTGLSAAAGALLAFCAYPAVRSAQLEWEQHYRAVRAKPIPAQITAAPAEPPKDPEAAKWEKLLAKAGAPGLTFRERIETRSGFSLLMRLPENGKLTYARLATYAENIEISASLPTGAVTFERATTDQGRALAREVWIHVDVEDVLSQRIDMPDEHTPLSINNAFPIGKYADGETIYLKLREIAALIVGVRGRGKTNLLNVIIHQLSRCTDVTLWMIDLKGGRAVKPWLRPWLEGKVKRPVLDWVATDRIEAHRMLAGARGLIDQRGQTGAGGSKIKPTRELPAVIVIADEVAAVVGARSGPKSVRDGEGETSAVLAGILTGCIQLGRSEAVDFILATQRSTVTMTGNGDLKSQCELRIGLGVTNPQDARSVFEGNSVAARLLAKLKDQATRGAVLIQDGDGGRITPGKSFYMGDDDEQRTVTRAAELHADFPAPLDQRGQVAVDAAVRKLGGDAGYFDRWSEERAGHLYSDDIPTLDETPPAPTPAATSVAPTSAIPTTGGARFFPRSSEKTPKPPSVDEEWAKIVAEYESSTAPESDYDTADPENVDRSARMVQIIDEAGDQGATASEVMAIMRAEGTLWKTRTTIYDALKKAIADGLVVRTGSDRRGRYYTPRHHG
ncbi:hypothetical protein [Polymorphospora lycopeni]|uniref:FtsK domain-containing protein n=1 Tax=Polymorphospora lycopeni TaxID=3140240 RepID=A0ABV5CL30_9ACTN